MNSSGNAKKTQWRWIIIYVLFGAEMIASLEIFSFPFFAWSSKILGTEKTSISDLLSFELLSDTLFSQSLRINVIVWWLLALIAMIFSLLFLQLFRKTSFASKNYSQFFFALSLALMVVFTELILLNQSYSSFSLLGKIILVFSFLIISALVLVLMMGFSRFACVKAFRAMPGLSLGVVLFLFFNFFRLYFGKATRPGIALNIILFFIFLLALMFFSWLRRDKEPGATLLKVSRLIMLLSIIFGIFLTLMPVWQWRKIFLSGYHHSGNKPDFPNVIMIVLDTARADHFSFYGYPRATTPFLEQLAKESVVFENAFSTAPWTLPSHASFFTGLYPSEHNCHYENMRLAKSYQTLAEDLSKMGYFTLGYSNNEMITRFSGLTQGFDRFVESSKARFYTGETVKLFFQTLMDENLYYDNGARATGRVIKKWLARINRHNTRYFLFINYMEAHIPYPQFAEAFKFFDQPDEARNRLKNKIPQYDIYNCHPELNSQIISDSVNWYDGALFYLDLKLKELFQFMRDNAYLDNTIIIILADHGESLGEHNLWGHAIGLYQQLLWVPLMIYAPDKLAPARIKRMVSLKDVPEMIQALLKDKSPLQIQDSGSEELKPVFAEVFRFKSKVQYFKIFCPDSEYLSLLDRRQKAVILVPYKLVWDSKDAHQLFNFVDDPQEMKNLFSSDEETFAELNNAIKLFLLAHPLPGETQKTLDAQTLKTLKALGYIR